MADGASKTLQRIAVERCIPLTVMLELTSRCNHACGFCFKAHSSPSSELTTAEVTGLLDTLAEMGSLYLHFTGGEALLRDDLRAIVQHARSRAFFVSLSSNGSLIDASVAAWIADLAVASVQISLHAADPALHDRLVGAPGGHQRALNAVGLLRARGVDVVLTCTVTRENLDQMDALTALGRGHGVDVRFDPRCLPPRRHHGGEAWPGADRGVLEAVLTRPDMRGSFLEDPAKVPREAGKPICAAGRTRVRIDEQGTIFPCASLLMPVGNVRQGFARVWSGSPALLALRGLTFDASRCTGCPRLSSCAPCIGRHYDQTGDILSPGSDVCWEASLRHRVMQEDG